LGKCVTPLRSGHAKNDGLIKKIGYNELKYK